MSPRTAAPDEEPPDEEPGRDRLPPHDRDAESALVGAMLLGGAAISRALDLVTAADLYVPEYRSIFAACERLWNRGAPTDPVTVAAELAGKVTRDRLLLISSDVPASANVAEYARIVASHAVARRAITYGERLAEAGWAGDLAEVESLSETGPESVRPLAEKAHVWELDELVKLADEDDVAPAKPWVIPGALRTQEVVILTGAEGSGKAVALRQVLVSVASGLHPFTHRPDGVERQPVLYVDLQENDVDMAHEDRKLRRAAGSAYQTGWFRAVSRKQGVNLAAARGQRWFEQLLRDHAPALVAVGPLVRMYRATARESRYSEELVDEVTAFLDEMMVRYAFALIIEGHAGNDRSDAEAWRVRGSSVWRSWPAFGFGLRMETWSPREAELMRWRGNRYSDRVWPRRLFQGHRWPWDPSEADYDRMLAAQRGGPDEPDPQIF